MAVTSSADTSGRLSMESADGRAALREARALLAAGDAQSARHWTTSVVDLADDLSSWTGAAALLPACLETSPLPRRARVAVLGSSTTTQLATLLPLACARAGLQIEIYEAPYGQYRQEILDPDSALYAFGPDAVVLALHDGDVNLPLVSDDPAAAVDTAVADLHGLWSRVAERSGATILQFTLAIPPERPFGHLGTSVPGSRYRLLQEINLRMAVEAPASVVLVDCARLANDVGNRNWFDARYWHLAKQAVSPRCIPLLTRHVGAVLAATQGLSRKVLVLDLDNTLWGGVLGEDGIGGIRLGEGTEGEAFSAFQAYVLDLKARGVVLAVCSKNDESLVRDAFSEHEGMRIGLDDIAVLSASWDDKPTQLRRIAEDLGLGLDSLVFVDDNPVERESVRHLVPEVDVVALPTDPAGYMRAVADYPYLETTRFTEEDTARTAQYRARASAAAAMGHASSLEEFLDSLEMEGSVAPVGSDNLVRVAQLVGKTNQFNLTSRRRTEAELQDLVADPAMVALAVRLRDRFADHGLVGVVLARQNDSDLEIDTWLMSCRVIGRTLEGAILGALDEQARSRGCSTISGTYVPTAKNALVADLYPRLGFASVGEPEPTGITRWSIRVGETNASSHVTLTTTAATAGKD